MAAIVEVTERIADATGRADVRVDESGLPVVYADDMFNRARGDFDCAQTELVVDHADLVAASIRVDRTPAAGCMPTVAVLMHEVIHALAPTAEHTTTGVFSERGSADGGLDAASLDRLCEHIHCIR